MVQNFKLGFWLYGFATWKIEIFYTFISKYKLKSIIFTFPSLRMTHFKGMAKFLRIKSLFQKNSYNQTLNSDEWWCNNVNTSKNDEFNCLLLWKNHQIHAINGRLSIQCWTLPLQFFLWVSENCTFTNWKSSKARHTTQG